MDIRVEDRPKAQAKTSWKAPPCALIIFGAGGDLTKRLLMPAIYNLARQSCFLRGSLSLPSTARLNRSKRFVNIWPKGSEISSRIRLPGQQPNRSTSGLGNSSSAASSISPATQPSLILTLGSMISTKELSSSTTPLVILSFTLPSHPNCLAPSSNSWAP